MLRTSLVLCSFVLCVITSLHGARARDTLEVKSYLVTTLDRVIIASAGFVQHARTYADLVTAEGGPTEAWQRHPDKVRALLTCMQDDYKAMDSYGYESIEGIVAGVKRFAPFDLYLDGGLPKGAGEPAEIAPVTITLPTGETIDREGSCFTYLIEPALWGGNRKWCIAADLDGDGQIGPREALPRPQFLTAVAAVTQAKLAELAAAVQAWQPSTEECFQAMVAMTPALSECFEEWKDSRYSTQPSNRYSAVSRVSDMRGILKSCAVMFRAVEPSVRQKDRPLTRAIGVNIDDVLAFLEWLEAKEEKNGAKFKPAVIDELIGQAKAKADKLVPQLKQAAALLGIHANG